MALNNTLHTADAANTGTAWVAYESANDSAITIITLCNHSVELLEVDIWLAPSGMGATDINLFIKKLEIISNDTFIAYQGGEKFILEDLDRIMVSVTNPTTPGAGTVSVIVSHVGI